MFTKAPLIVYTSVEVECVVIQPGNIRLRDVVGAGTEQLCAENLGVSSRPAAWRKRIIIRCYLPRVVGSRPLFPVHKGGKAQPFRNKVEVLVKV